MLTIILKTYVDSYLYNIDMEFYCIPLTLEMLAGSDVVLGEKRWRQDLPDSEAEEVLLSFIGRLKNIQIQERYTR